MSAPTTIIDYFDIPKETLTAWGDSVYDDPGELHRVYYHNIDGLKNQNDVMGLYISSMAQFYTSTFFWADIGLNLNQIPVRQALNRKLVAHFGLARSASSQMHTAAVPAGSAEFTSAYQPGGTFTASTGKWATRCTGKPIIDSSGLGCWSGLTFLGKRGKSLQLSLPIGALVKVHLADLVFMTNTTRYYYPVVLLNLTSANNSSWTSPWQ